MNFMKHSGLSLRLKTAIIQKELGQVIDKVVYTIQVFIPYEAANIIAMDGTAVWTDMLAETTINKTGWSEIFLIINGHKKVCVSVSLTAMANKKKLKPFTIFAGAKHEIKSLDQCF